MHCISAIEENWLVSFSVACSFLCGPFFSFHCLRQTHSMPVCVSCLLVFIVFQLNQIKFHHFEWERPEPSYIQLAHFRCTSEEHATFQKKHWMKGISRAHLDICSTSWKSSYIDFTLESELMNERYYTLAMMMLIHCG